MPVKDPNIKPKEIDEVSILESREHEIILYNDDVNTFDHVINMLCKYCDHDLLQAEQCAWIVHNNGKCMIKRGEFSTLKPICSALLDAGLSAKIL